MTENVRDRDSLKRVVELDWREHSQPSEAVVEAIAAASDSDPLELEPLQYAVEVDALDALLTSDGDVDGGPIRVAFAYEGYGVLVESTGHLAVYSEPVERL